MKICYDKHSCGIPLCGRKANRWLFDACFLAMIVFFLSRKACFFDENEEIFKNYAHICMVIIDDCFVFNN